MRKRYQQRGENAEIDLLRIVMIQRGLTYRDLAQMMQKKPQRVANLLSGSDRTWPIRAAVNSALRKGIFSKPPSDRRRMRRIQRPPPTTTQTP